MTNGFSRQQKMQSKKNSAKLTLWSVNEDEALQYLQVDPGATRGLLDLRRWCPTGLASSADSLILRAFKARVSELGSVGR
jgi:hypothetical protein